MVWPRGNQEGVREIVRGFSKKNASYRIEKTISERQAAVLVSVLWENALHTLQTPRSVIRMAVLLLPEDEEWAIFLIQIAPLLDRWLASRSRPAQTRTCPLCSQAAFPPFIF
jgi:hypothetical protein